MADSGVLQFGKPTRLPPSPTKNGGEEEIRTLDPHVANVMLYQLSYFPITKNAA